MYTIVKQKQAQHRSSVENDYRYGPQSRLKSVHRKIGSDSQMQRRSRAGDRKDSGGENRRRDICRKQQRLTAQEMNTGEIMATVLQMREPSLEFPACLSRTCIVLHLPKIHTRFMRARKMSRRLRECAWTPLLQESS